MMGEAVGAAIFPVFLSAAAVWAAALSYLDLRWQRLPDRLTVPAILFSVLIALLWQPAAILGGLAWGLFYLLIAVLLGGLGGGDIKLAASLGTLVVLAAGAAGWFLAVAGASLSSAVLMISLRRAVLPHGPSMLLASGGAVAAGLTGLMN